MHSHAHHGDCHHARNLLWALGINVVIMIAEIIGGIRSSSLGLLSDAAHVGFDVATLGLAYITLLLRQRSCRQLGRFHRWPFESVSCALVCLGLMIAVLLIIGQAIARLVHQQLIDAPTMMWVAAVGLVGNLLVLWIIRHSESRGIMRAVLIDALSDTLFSVGVIVSGAVIHWTGYVAIDPILSLLISGFIAIHVVKLGRDTLTSWPRTHVCA